MLDVEATSHNAVEATDNSTALPPLKVRVCYYTSYVTKYGSCGVVFYGRAYSLVVKSVAFRNHLTPEKWRARLSIKLLT